MASSMCTCGFEMDYFENQVQNCGSHISCDVIEFSDEGMLDDVNRNFRRDYHEDVRKQHPEVIYEQYQHC